jgi:hypothetical protein
MAATISTLTYTPFTMAGDLGVSLSVTQATGSNRYMYVVLQRMPNVTPNSVTYAGVAMTKIVSNYNAQSSYLDVYQLANSAEGANNLVLNYTQYQSYGAIGIFAFSCIGAAGYGNTANNSGAKPLSVNISSISSGSAIALIGFVPNSTYTQDMTIDGNAVTEYYNSMGGSAGGALGLKNGVTGGNCSISPTGPYNSYGYAIEIKAAVSTTAPTGVTTYAADQIATNGARIYGSVATNGGATISSFGFYWGYTNNPTTQAQVGTGDNFNVFNALFNALNPGTTVYYKAYATNSVGTSYGSVMSFTTLSTRRIFSVG